MACYKNCAHDRTNKNLAYVQKLYFHPPTNHSKVDSYKTEAQKVDQFIQSYVQDGMDGIPFSVNGHCGYFQTPSLVYSLNKRKRWVLPELLESVITEKGFICSKDEISLQMNVSSMLRRTDLARTSAYSWELPRTPQILKISSTVFNKTATPSRENGAS